MLKQLITMQIINEIELLKIQEEALEFTKNNISTDNWDLIYDLKRQLLIAERNFKVVQEERNQFKNRLINKER